MVNRPLKTRLASRIYDGFITFFRNCNKLCSAIYLELMLINNSEIMSEKLLIQ